MDAFEDKSWVKLRRIDDAYKRALDAFLDYAFATSAFNNKIACPCHICANRRSFERNIVRNHLIINEMDKDYQKCIWNFHGESRAGDNDDMFDDEHDTESGDELDTESEDEMVGMINDAFESREPTDNSSSGPNDEAKAFFKLVEDAGQPLYGGCEEFSKLSFIVEMYHLKCFYGITNVAFDALVKLFKRALPKDSTLPDSFKKVQRIIKTLGLEYEKIDVCPNDCILFWKQSASLDNCPNYNTLRWKTDDDGIIIQLVNGNKVPRKVLRHFPLIPRIKRLFMSSKTAHLMRWHEEGRKKDGKLRHPADSFAWQDFNIKNPDFAREPRNVRLGLTSDGFNPFGMMNTQYSVWPVVIMNYNLPPWLCMKQPYFILSLLIPGPKGPGNDIDVFLEPLIDELEELWKVGIETYDASKDETFRLRVALTWTVNDFPAYGNLSGWKIKGRHACPYCNVDTCSLYLKGSRKLCYMGHRRFLDDNHRYRRSKKAFNGEREMRPPPRSWSGLDLLRQMEGLHVKFGKDPETQKFNKTRRGDGVMPWKKKSIFFRLPYWEHLVIRHNIDVMHVEKNVFESLIGTLFGIEGKTKDTLQSRLDLVDLKIRHNLHPIDDGHKTYLPPACFTLSNKEKEDCLSVLASIKVPDGYASNIRRRVEKGKIHGLKSHDHHIIMQHLLPLLARKIQNKDLSSALIELSNFFKELCYKVATMEDFERLKHHSVLLLCHLERIFNPSFFDIMVHLVIHLAHEAALAGPVFYRWMYPPERCMGTFKSYGRSKSRVEASIAEGYIAEEALTFCSRYLHGVQTRENRSMRNNDDDGDEAHEGISVFSIKFRAMSKRKSVQPNWSLIEQAHRYVLANCDEVEVYAQEHFEHVGSVHRNNPGEIDAIHRKEFPKWFEENVSRHLPSNVVISEDLRCLSQFPSMWTKTMTKVTCNGYRWRVKSIDKRSVNQNSGVLVNANTEVGEIFYYGVLTKIIELSYPQRRSVVLFQCDWVDPSRGVKKDEFGFTVVNLKAILKTDEPFVLASQALQVFYTPEPREINWHVVTVTKPRDLFEMEEDVIPEVDSLQDDVPSHPYDESSNIVRQDVIGVTIDEPLADLVQRSNDDMDADCDSNDEEDDTLYDYFSD